MLRTHSKFKPITKLIKTSLCVFNLQSKSTNFIYLSNLVLKFEKNKKNIFWPRPHQKLGMRGKQGAVYDEVSKQTNKQKQKKNCLKKNVFGAFATHHFRFVNKIVLFNVTHHFRLVNKIVLFVVTSLGVKSVFCFQLFKCAFCL